MNSAKVMQSWKDGLLSDVEVLYQLAAHLPTSPFTDAAIEVIGKMYQEEVAEWEEDARLADICHRADDVNDNGQPLVDQFDSIISERKTVEMAAADIEPFVSPEDDI